MLKTINSIPAASVKTFLGVPMANIKTIDGLAAEAPPTGPWTPATVPGLRMWHKADEGVWSKTAATFNAANIEYLTMASSPTIRFGNIPWSIGGWLRSDNVTGTYVIMAKRGSPAVDYQIYNAPGGSLICTAYNGVTHPGANGGTYSPGVWTFVIASYDGTYLYCQINNGANVAMSAGVLSDTTDPLAFGTDISNTGGFAYPGHLQNWFLFGRALNTAERTFLYNSGAGRHYGELDTAIKTDLRAWWPFDENGGSRVDVHNGLVLTDVNTVTTLSPGFIENPASSGSLIERVDDFGLNGIDQIPYSPNRRPLYLKNQLNDKPVIRFNGVDNGLGSTAEIAPGDLCAPSAQTVFLIAKQNVTGNVPYEWGPAENHLGMNATWTDGNLYWDTGHASGGGRTTAPVANLPSWTGYWKRIECWRSGTQGVIRVDDVTVGTTTLSDTFDPPGPSLFYLGIHPTGAYGYNGDIAEFLVYNRALTTEEREAVASYLYDKWFNVGPDSIAGLGVWYKADVGVMSQSAAQFTAANGEYLSIPHNSGLTLGNIPWAVGGWIYLDSVVGVTVPFAKRTIEEYQIFINSGTINGLFFHVGNAVYTSVTAPITAGSWYFVIFQYDSAAATATLYLNNAVAASSSAGIPTTGTGPLLVGGSPEGGQYTNSRMQNWFIFGRGLSATERTFLYNSGNGRSYEELDTAFKTDLRGWWPLDEVSGSRRDLSGNSNTLTDNNTVGVIAGKVLNPAGSNGTPITTWRDFSPNEFHLGVAAPTNSPVWQGNERNGNPVVRFNGTSSTMITAPILGSYLCAPQAQTVFVVQKNASGSSSTYNWLGEAVSNLNTHLPYGGVLYYDVGHYTTCRISVPQPEPWLNTWHLVEMYRDGSTGAILVEGVQPPGTALALTGSFIDTATAPLYLGSASAAYFIAGDVAEFIIYKRALSAAERTTVREYLMAKWGFS